MQVNHDVEKYVASIRRADPSVHVVSFNMVSKMPIDKLGSGQETIEMTIEFTTTAKDVDKE